MARIFQTLTRPARISQDKVMRKREVKPLGDPENLDSMTSRENRFRCWCQLRMLRHPRRRNVIKGTAVKYVEGPREKNAE
jgi:hypothetical protein